MKSSPIAKQYVLDEKDRKIDVMIDIKTFNKIEEAMENYSIIQFIEENVEDKPLKSKEAKAYYKKLKKAE